MLKLFFLFAAGLCLNGMPLRAQVPAGAAGRSGDNATEVLVMSLNCTLTRPESFFRAGDAVVTVSVTGAQPPYQCVWSGGPQGASGTKNNITCNPFSIAGLTANGFATGVYYTLTVTTGSLTATCQVLVKEGAVPAPPSCADFANAGCKTALLAALKTALVPPSSSLCKQWEGANCDLTGRIFREGRYL